MKLECIQEFMKREFLERDQARGLFATFTWLVEEVGELADALLKNNREKIEAEIADVIAWTLSLANLLGINVARALDKKYGVSIMCRG